MNKISLATNGDDFERHYHSQFLEKEFPSYEGFWLKFVVPLTNRPLNIHFKTDQELNSLGLGINQIVIAQLHYSVLRHLARAFEIKARIHINLDELTEGIVRIVGAQDIAFELLERHQDPGEYDPWLPVRQGPVEGSREARRAWQEANNYPLQNIRNYRNNLVHGRLVPGVIGDEQFIPRIGIEIKYFDWRLITDNPNMAQVIGVDLIPANEILNESWDQTLDYFEIQWRQNLI